jgi:hypothetical protein
MRKPFKSGYDARRNTEGATILASEARQIRRLYRRIRSMRVVAELTGRGHSTVWRYTRDLVRRPLVRHRMAALISEKP